MRDWIAERVGAGILGLVIGVFIALAVVVLLGDIDLWWLLVAIPLGCAAFAAVVGEKAIDVLKQLAWWSS